MNRKSQSRAAEDSQEVMRVNSSFRNKKLIIARIFNKISGKLHKIYEFD